MFSFNFLKFELHFYCYKTLKSKFFPFLLAVENSCCPTLLNFHVVDAIIKGSSIHSPGNERFCITISSLLSRKLSHPKYRHYSKILTSKVHFHLPSLDFQLVIERLA